MTKESGATCEKALLYCVAMMGIFYTTRYTKTRWDTYVVSALVALCHARIVFKILIHI